MPTEKLLRLADLLDTTAVKLRDSISLLAEFIHPAEAVTGFSFVCDHLAQIAQRIREGEYD